MDYIRAKSRDTAAESSYEKLCRNVVMKWPKDGRLWAELTNSDGEHRVTLSPPFMVSVSLSCDDVVFTRAIDTAQDGSGRRLQ